jgi:hypothetical protein
MVKKGRFICEDENPFTITISKTPVLSQPFNIAFADLTHFHLVVISQEREEVEQNILLAITSSKIKLYTYAAPDNPNCFDEKKFNTIYPLNFRPKRRRTLC